MKLSRFELRAVRLPLVERFVTAAGTLEAREGFLVRVGKGVGEALPLPTSGTETLEQCRAALEAARVLEGREARSVIEVEALLSEVNALELAPCARLAVETALLDLLGRELGLPVSQLLSQTARDQVQVNAVLDATDSAAVRARELRDEGFTSFKLKVGDAAGVERARQVREAIGPDAELRLDANGAWSLSDAASALRQLERVHPSYCEDPLAGPELVTALRAATTVGIAADAWLASAAGRRQVIEGRLADVLVLKPAVIGGLRRALVLAAEGRARGMTVVVTTTLEGVVARLAALHLAAALPKGTASGLATGALLAKDHAVDPAPVVKGFMDVPARAGLGVEVRA